METPAAKPSSRWSMVATASRVLKGAGHASILLWLALPLVALVDCSGPVVQYSGYQALNGVPFPADQFQLPAGQYPDFGRDWWVLGIILLAVAGVAMAWLGGVKGAFLSLGVAVAGFVILQPAIGFFTPPETARTWTPEAGQGGSLIGLVYIGSALLDLGWMFGKSWSKVGRGRGAKDPDRGEWMALSLFSGAGLTLMLLAVAALVVLVVALRSPSG